MKMKVKNNDESAGETIKRIRPLTLAIRKILLFLQNSSGPLFRAKSVIERKTIFHNQHDTVDCQSCSFSIIIHNRRCRFRCNSDRARLLLKSDIIRLEYQSTSFSHMKRCCRHADTGVDVAGALRTRGKAA